MLILKRDKTIEIVLVTDDRMKKRKGQRRERRESERRTMLQGLIDHSKKTLEGIELAQPIYITCQPFN